MSGEFWITDSGVDFADGDVGDYNHEGIVINQVQRQIVDKCEKVYDVTPPQTYYGRSRSWNDDEGVDWDAFCYAVAEAYAKELIKVRPVRQAEIEEELKEEPERLWTMAMKRAKVSDLEISVANGQSDARDYAMEYWGWKTYRDGYIDTWNFRKSDLDAIVAGIESIADSEGWSDKRLSRMAFTINIFSTGKHLTLSYPQMKQRNERPKPTATTPQTTNLIDYGTQQAKQQVSDIEKQSMNPYYAQKKFPYADSRKLDMSFRSFLNG